MIYRHEMKSCISLNVKIRGLVTSDDYTVTIARGIADRFKRLLKMRTGYVPPVFRAARGEWNEETHGRSAIRNHSSEGD
jgi:hypothetical protein